MATLDDFVSFLQGASNSAASNLSAPVDGINWLLGKAGLPVSKAPVGGSDWLRQAGFTAEPKNRNAGLLGEFVGGVIPIVAAAKAPQIAAWLNQAGRNLSAPRTLNPQTGAIVWHGSPHKFDKFSTDKIGTGEGAQAYGHGLYLAEKPEIAAGYRERLSTNYLDNSGAQKAAGDAWTEAMQAAQDAGAKHPDHARAIAGQVQAWVDSGKQAKTFLRYNQPPAGTEAQYKAAADALEGLAKNPGNLYKTDIPDEAVARFLDWDKPLSQQSKEVQNALRSLIGKPAGTSGLLDSRFLAAPSKSGALEYGATGGQIYQELGSGSHIDLTKALQEKGVQGIKYFDGVSRGGGTGTRNFVAFDPEMIRILERNGQPTGQAPWGAGEYSKLRGLLKP